MTAALTLPRSSGKNNHPASLCYNCGILFLILGMDRKVGCGHIFNLRWFFFFFFSLKLAPS